MANNNQVLDDHKKIGKKYIPPFVYKLDNKLQEASWIKQGIPEFIWIALINYYFGPQKGVDLSLSLAKAAKEVSGQNTWYAPASSYSQLTRKQKKEIVSILEKSGKLSEIRQALSIFNLRYPKSPLRFLNVKSKVAKEAKQSFLIVMKNTITELYDKTTKEAIFVQANGVYIAFVTGLLQVTKDTSLAHFPEIEKYPSTEESKKVAAAVRSSINGFLGMYSNDIATQWQNYFWNRGLKIDKCEIEL